MVVEKKWAVFWVVIVLILIGFIATNKLWFYPQFTAKITRPPVYTRPADNPSDVSIEPFDVTLRQIIQEPEAVNIAGPTQTKRNPFLWKGELTPPPPPKRTKEVQPVEIPRLGMIITGENSKTAMLDNSLVHPGDSYGGHVVESISSEFIILSGDYGVLKISMPPTSFGAAKVDILEEKNPNLLIQPVFAEKRQKTTRR